jgi:hypothetical protein
MKKTFTFLIFIALVGYYYFSSEAEEKASFDEEENTKEHLREKSLHEAFSKIVQKNEIERQNEERTPASEGENMLPPLDYDEIDHPFVNLSIEDYQKDVSELSNERRENIVNIMKFEIDNDEKALEEIAKREQRDLMINEEEKKNLEDRLDKKKNKLELFIERTQVFDE